MGGGGPSPNVRAALIATWEPQPCHSQDLLTHFPSLPLLKTRPIHKNREGFPSAHAPQETKQKKKNPPLWNSCEDGTEMDTFAANQRRAARTFCAPQPMGGGGVQALRTWLGLNVRKRSVLPPPSPLQVDRTLGRGRRHGIPSWLWGVR